MHVAPMIQPKLLPRSGAIYTRALHALHADHVPFLVGGAYALARFAGIGRYTKDIDLFVLPEDTHRVLASLSRAGFRTELTDARWLAKAFRGRVFLDIVFSSANGIATVDLEWFRHAVAGDVLGVPVEICPAEESIWSKAWVMDRDRYDGADIHHMIRGYGHDLDWDRMLWRFGEHWRVLLSHLVLFAFVYPGERGKVPARVLQDLSARLCAEEAGDPPDERTCRGTLFSREQYRVDVERWGYRDARMEIPAPLQPGAEAPDRGDGRHGR